MNNFDPYAELMLTMQLLCQIPEFKPFASPVKDALRILRKDK